MLCRIARPFRIRPTLLGIRRVVSMSEINLLSRNVMPVMQKYERIALFSAQFDHLVHKILIKMFKLVDPHL